MKKYLFLALLLLSISFVSAYNLDYVNNDVYIDVAGKGTLLVSPITLSGGCGYINFTNKANTNTYILDYGMNENISLTSFGLWSITNIGNGSYGFVSQNITQESLNYDNKSIWYHVNPISLTKNINYYAQFCINSLDNTNGKYDVGLHLSSQTLNQSIMGGTLFLLDPWWNSTTDTPSIFNWASLDNGSSTCNFSTNNLTAMKNSTGQFNSSANMFFSKVVGTYETLSSAKMNTTASEAGASGLKMIALANVTLISMTKGTGDTSTQAYIFDATRTTRLANSTFVGSTATFNYNLINGTTYYFLGNGTGAYTKSYNVTNFYPINGTYTRIINGSAATGIDNSGMIYNIQSYQVVTYPNITNYNAFRMILNASDNNSYVRVSGDNGVTWSPWLNSSSNNVSIALPTGGTSLMFQINLTNVNATYSPSVYGFGLVQDTLIYNIIGQILYNSSIVANSRMFLYNDSDVLVANTTSNSTGGYTFSNLINNTWYIVNARFSNSTSHFSVSKYFNVVSNLTNGTMDYLSTGITTVNSFQCSSIVINSGCSITLLSGSSCLVS